MQETTRREQQNTFGGIFLDVRQFRQFYYISSRIAILVTIMSISQSSINHRSILQLPFVKAFQLKNSHHYVPSRYQRIHIDSQQKNPPPNNIHSSTPNIRQRLNDVQQQQRILAMPATTVSSSSASESAAEINLSLTVNETSTDHNVEILLKYTGSTSENSVCLIPNLMPNSKVWDSYNNTMNHIIQREFKYRNRGALQPEELSKVQEYLLQNQAITQAMPIDLLSESRNEVRDQLDEQKRRFLDHTNFTKPMYALYCRCLLYICDLSAREQIRSPVLPTWYKIRECGLCPRENAITTCLYVLSMQQQQQQRPLSSTVPTQIAENDMDDIDDPIFRNTGVEVAIFHDLLYNSNEKTALVRIKGYIADHNVQGAEEILATLQIKTQETNGQHFEESMSFKRLRTYQPIFQYYCDTGNIIDALRIYREMQNTWGVHLVPETYGTLISSVARHGWFRNEDEISNPIKTLRSKAMKQLKFQCYCGPDFLDELCSEMSRDVLELDESCAAMIIDGFSTGFNYSQSTTPFVTMGWMSDISQWFQRFLQSPAKVKTTDTKNSRRIFLERVSIDNTTAMCSSSGAKLRLLTLSKQQIRNVHDSLLQMAEFEQEKYSEKTNHSNKSKHKKATNHTTTTNTVSVKRNDQDTKNRSIALKELSLFSDWLRYRTGDPYTAIIDGPNVAYYGRGDVRWCQVEHVLNKLEGMGENPLVIMPQKYISPKFYIASLNRTQKLSTSDIAFIDKLIASKKIYVVPSGCLDDYYWMLSSVAQQKSRSNYVQQHVPTDDATGRFPGLRPLLVTNDQMRDHRLALLEPRLFRRWASCHIVKYHIEPLEDEKPVKNAVTFYPADFFSREIQCNKAFRLGDSTVWHIPIAEWPEPDRLCISVIR